MNIETEIKTIQEFVDKGNFHAALNIGLSAMNECRRNQDQAGVDTFIAIIKDIANTIADEFGS